MFVLVYTNVDGNAKRFNARKYYLPKAMTKSFNVIINRKSFDQATNSNIKRYKEIRKLTAVQSEDYTTGCLLDYECIKNHYRLIAVDVSGQEENPNPNLQIQKQFKKNSLDN